jgi:hypothetical protein
MELLVFHGTYAARTGLCCSPARALNRPILLWWSNLWKHTQDCLQSSFFSSCCCLHGNDTEKNLPFLILGSRHGGLTVSVANLMVLERAVMCQEGQHSLVLLGESVQVCLAMIFFLLLHCVSRPFSWSLSKRIVACRKLASADGATAGQRSVDYSL